MRKAVMLFTLKVDGTVNQGRSLEFMLVAVFFFREILDEMNMLAVSDFDGAACLSTEFVKVFIRKVGAEFDLMIMVVFVFPVDCFVRYGAESVVMTIITSLVKYSGTAGYFVDMLLLFLFIILFTIAVVAVVIVHHKTPFSFTI